MPRKRTPSIPRCDLAESVKQRQSEVQQKAKSYIAALTTFFEAQETWKSHHWKPRETLRIGSKSRNRTEQDLENTQALHSATDDMMIAWLELKKAMAEAVRQQSFGHTTIKLRGS